MGRSWVAALIAAGMAACSPAASHAERAPASAPNSDELLGSTVLIGVTYYHAGGEFSHQTQIYGVVERVEPEDGVMIRLQGPRAGEEFWLPPDLDAFEAAPPGDYRLRSTGEVVTDPDFTTTWTIEMPPDA